MLGETHPTSGSDSSLEGKTKDGAGHPLSPAAGKHPEHSLLRAVPALKWIN